MVTRKNTAAAMLPRITRRQDFGICFPSVKLNDHEDRYGNIIIVNKYYGVRRINKKGKNMYKAVIHIKGDFVIGIFARLEEYKGQKKQYSS